MHTPQEGCTSGLLLKSGAVRNVAEATTKRSKAPT